MNPNDPQVQPTPPAQPVPPTQPAPGPQPGVPPAQPQPPAPVAAPVQPNASPTFSGQPMQPQAAAGGQQFPCWYLTGLSDMSSKPGTAVLYAGALVMLDANGQEAYRIALTPDIKVEKFVGRVRIYHVAGQNTGMLDRKYSFWFYNPKLNWLSGFIGLFYMGKAKAFANGLKQAAGAA